MKTDDYDDDDDNTYANKKNQDKDNKTLTLYEKSIITMDAFYRELDKLLKPKSLGKMLKDKKKRTAQSAYQKEKGKKMIY